MKILLHLVLDLKCRVRFEIQKRNEIKLILGLIYADYNTFTFSLRPIWSETSRKMERNHQYWSSIKAWVVCVIFAQTRAHFSVCLWCILFFCVFRFSSYIRQVRTHFSLIWYHGFIFNGSFPKVIKIAAKRHFVRDILLNWDWRFVFKQWIEWLHLICEDVVLPSFALILSNCFALNCFKRSIVVFFVRNPRLCSFCSHFVHSLSELHSFSKWNSLLLQRKARKLP